MAVMCNNSLYAVKKVAILVFTANTNNHADYDLKDEKRVFVSRGTAISGNGD